MKFSHDYAKAVANSKLQGLEDLTDPSDTEKQMKTRSGRLRKRQENESEQQPSKKTRLSQTLIYSSDEELNNRSTNKHTDEEEAIKVPTKLNRNKNKDFPLEKSGQVAKSRDKLEEKKQSSTSGGTSSESNGQKKKGIPPVSAIYHLSDDEENGNKDKGTISSKKTCISPRSALQQLASDNDDSADLTLKNDYSPDLLRVIYDVCCKLLTKVNALTAKVEQLESTVSKQKLLVANSSQNSSIP
ncbi:hypothetical protein TKK_0012478 [Trichogramma kaykai]